MTAISQNLAATYLAPEDSVDEVSVLRFAISRLIAKMETMIPVTVIAVHPGTGSPPVAGTVDVQPLLTMLDGGGNATQPGTVYGLPFFRLQGGPWAIIMDPAVNDFGFIVSASRDISNLTKNQPSPAIANPGSYRCYSYSDGIYVGGTMNPVPAATCWFKSDGTFQIATKDGVVIKSDGSGNLNMTCTTLTVNGAIKATGEVTAKSGGASFVTLSQHKHSANNTPPTPGF